jgi:hypothetical protein
MNRRENGYCLNRTFFFVNVFDFFLFFFISTSVQRQGVTDDFLELVPPHPFAHTFTFLCFLSLSFSFSFALSLHQHTTNDIIIWAFHSLLALCINYICVRTSNTLSIYLSILVLDVYNSNSWVHPTKKEKKKTNTYWGNHWTEARRISIPLSLNKLLVVVVVSLDVCVCVILTASYVQLGWLTNIDQYGTERKKLYPSQLSNTTYTFPFFFHSISYIRLKSHHQRPWWRHTCILSSISSYHRILSESEKVKANLHRINIVLFFPCANKLISQGTQVNQSHF